eukprot:scaffold5479_cov199-Amphora_coffeaeformis.AAC.89
MEFSTDGSIRSNSKDREIEKSSEDPSCSAVLACKNGTRFVFPSALVKTSGSHTGPLQGPCRGTAESFNDLVEDPAPRHIGGT